MDTLYISKDSYIKEDAADTNYGSANIIYAGCGTNKLRRAYISFDITGVTVANISSATFHFRIETGDYASRQLKFERITSAWTENVVTWNTGNPTITATNSVTSAAIGDFSPGTWYSVDVTNMIKDEGTTIFGFRITDSNEATAIQYFKGIESSEALDDNPYLELNYGDKYVDIGTGNDSDSGNTWALAYQTVKKGIDNVGSTAVLFIGEGDYSAQAAIDLNKNLILSCEDYSGGNANPPLTVTLPATV